MIFRTAVDDEILSKSPCRNVKLPKDDSKNNIVPLPKENVAALAEAIGDYYGALVLLAAGTGLRQGEAFGLTLDAVDFPRKQLRVEKQIVLIGGVPYIGAPKTEKSRRTVPIPDVVLHALVAHVAAYPPVPVEVFDARVRTKDGDAAKTVEVPPLFTWQPPKRPQANSNVGGAIRRNRFNEAVWRPAVKLAGLADGTGFHDLRHFYASLLIRHGESVKVVQERLGHSSPVETLETYAHLCPDSDDRTRAAVDAVLGSDFVGQAVDKAAR